MKFKIDLYLKSVFMGIAEIIPGVSGGTIAFITGIYEELIDSIKSVDGNAIKLLFSFKFSLFWKQINGTFLLTLLLGMLTSILALSRIIVFLIDQHPFKIWGFFFGLIIASAIVIFYQIETVNSKVVVSTIIGLLISAYIALEAPSSTPNSNLFIFISGAIAISAMILPGISGSFILVFLSKYEFILKSLNNFDVTVISIFIGGCIVGLVTFSRVFSYLFKKYNDVVISVLVGFLLGSLFKVWPFYKVLEYNTSNEPIYTNPVLPSSSQESELIYFIVFSIIGFLSMWLLEKKYIGLNKEI
jgi:putative membrane protein|tara:strand:+ start:763 stop:1665 length:903 start_codon:yes stop_codon:yes gene_type:complete